jgi:hypothetical protein
MVCASRSRGRNIHKERCTVNVAFIIAGLFFVATIAMSMLVLFANAMSDNPQQANGGWKPALAVFIFGTLWSALIAGSHFIHLQW